MTTWDKIKGVPPLVASVLAIVSAIIATLVWVTGYFATNMQLDYVKCISDNNENLLSLQIASGNSYANFIAANVKLDKLKKEEAAGAKVDPENIQELKADSQLYWESLQKTNSDAVEVVNMLKSGKCVK